MKRSYILPSELQNRHEHDCRSDSSKFLDRSLLFDVSVFSTLMANTRSSMNLFYDNSLYTDNSSNPVKPKNKCLKETVLNTGHSSYGNLIWSNSITCSSNGDIFMADRFQNRVVVFNKELIYKYSIDNGKGSAPGQFDEPSSVCISEGGKLYVADKNNKRIQIFAECKRNRDNVKSVKLGGLFEDFGRKTGTTLGSIKSSKVVGEFGFSSFIELDDRPVKLCSSAFSGIMAVSTKNGMIFVFNEWNEIISYLKLCRPVDSLNVQSFCLDDFGEKLIHFQHDSFEQKIKIRIYQTQSKNPLERNGKQPYKMNLIEKKDLQTDYFPGIRLNRADIMKMSLDSKHFMIFDSLNLNLLEFDLNGKFSRIVLKAEERLGQVLAFDFNGDNLVSSELVWNKRGILEQKCKSSLDLNKLNDGLTWSETEKIKLSTAHLFKLKKFSLAESNETTNNHQTAKEYETNFTKSFNFE